MKNIITTILLISVFPTWLLSSGSIKGKIKYEGETLENVVIYLEPLEEKSFPPSKEIAVMDQKNLSFVPHVLPVLIGTKIVFPNSDRLRHNVFSMSKIKKFDFGTYPPGSEKSIICDEAGVIPILCYIHHDMSAYIVVLETPYFTITNEKGEYEMDNIPNGKYKLSFWHEEFEFKTEEVSIFSDAVITKDIQSTR